MEIPEIGVELARVTSHQLPVFPREARAVAEDLHLSETEMRKLFADGLLSFDPTLPEVLDEAHEAELVFVGMIARAGFGRRVMRSMLSGLERPYAYDPRCIFFDFRVRAWKLFPSLRDPESAFFALLERLDANRETEILTDIRRWLDDALDVAQDRDKFFEHLRHFETPASDPIDKEHDA